MYSSGMNSEFEKFITVAGGPGSASKALACTEGLISHIRTGKRDVSKALAKSIIDKYPEISLHSLLFPNGQPA